MARRAAEETSFQCNAAFLNSVVGRVTDVEQVNESSGNTEEADARNLSRAGSTVSGTTTPASIPLPLRKRWRTERTKKRRHTREVNHSESLFSRAEAVYFRSCYHGIGTVSQAYGVANVGVE